MVSGVVIDVVAGWLTPNTWILTLNSIIIAVDVVESSILMILLHIGLGDGLGPLLFMV